MAVEEPKKLPETGPAEFMLLAILAMVLGFGLLKFRARS
ncbi:LPXTG cell wall anchor domain-containing protein [Patescibacteria group bacterium]